MRATVTQIECLVNENVGLVYMVLKRFSGRGQEIEDLFQIGVIGLLKAIDKEQAFSPLSVNRVEFGADAVIVSQHIVPETEKTMKVYHLIFHLNDTERKEAADVAR